MLTYTTLSATTNTVTLYNYNGTTDTATAWGTWVQDTGTANITAYGSNDIYTYDYVWDSWQVQVNPYTQPAQVRAWQQPVERDVAHPNASEKAKELLEEVLSQEQVADFRKGYIVVEGSKGNKYTIATTYSQAGNVQAHSGPRAGRRLCAHPRAQVPNADAWLAQKLMLETDEDAFLAIANAS